MNFSGKQITELNDIIEKVGQDRDTPFEKVLMIRFIIFVMPICIDNYLFAFASIIVGCCSR